MPHLILEASSNIIETNDKIKISLQNCQQVVAKTLGANVNNCISRALLHDVFVIGDNCSDQAFLQLTVKVLKGRTPEQLNLAVQDLYQTLKNDFQKSINHLELKISVEIIELSNYFTK